MKIYLVYTQLILNRALMHACIKMPNSSSNKESNALFFFQNKSIARNVRLCRYVVHCMSIKTISQVINYTNLLLNF